MKRKFIRLFIVGLLILAIMIMTGCAKEETTVPPSASAPKLNVSIKIEATASTWRGSEPYDIYGAIEEKLEEVGFDIVPQASTNYDAILLVDYKETKGSSYSLEGSAPGTMGYGTNITCNLILENEIGNRIFETEISATTSYRVEGGGLYQDAVHNFEHKPCFKYLGESIASQLGYATPMEHLIQALTQALNDEDELVRRDAAKTLGEIGDTRAVEPLIQALEDEESGVRMYAAMALAKIGDAKAVEPLIQALEDEESGVRREAAEALGEIGDERAIEPLIQALEDEHPMVQVAAKEALKKIRGY
jgi:hypothetical protein